MPKKYFSKDLRFVYPSEFILHGDIARMCLLNNLEDRGMTNSLSVFPWVKCMWKLERTRMVTEVGWSNMRGSSLGMGHRTVCG